MPIRFAQRPGLVVYLTVGDPDVATTRAIALAAIDAGADVLELGVPFSDPLADGPVIERASHRAVAHGTSMADVLTLARDIRAARPSAGLVIFSYLNPILRYGLQRFCADASAAGVDGVLATDLTIEEADGAYLDAMRAAALAPIFLAAPTSTDARLERIAALSQGFVYAVSRVGITGTQQTLAGDARSLVDRLRRYTKLPVALGFGVSNAEHVAALGEFADAAVIGSAIVGLIEKSTPQDAPTAVARFIEGCGQSPLPLRRANLDLPKHLNHVRLSPMDIGDWRCQIDALDQQIVELLNQRAEAARAIGKLKEATDLPVYEPNRERIIFDNVRSHNRGPLPDSELVFIYRRVVDVMRCLQRNELASQSEEPK